MAYVPGNLVFPSGTMDDETGTTGPAYEIGQTEVTNALGREVFQWARDNGKFDGEGAFLNSEKAVYGSRVLMGIHPVGTAGNNSGNESLDGIPMSGNANQLGLFDMNGNVWEWVFDKVGSTRGMRGGSWYYPSVYHNVGFHGNHEPEGVCPDVGFRLARTFGPAEAQARCPLFYSVPRSMGTKRT